ncbi:MAG: penicillin acylase family protein [Acidobacteriales bacterium]|nr:penicillin acylase family protein [Terriglobales bacterium]
MAGTNTEVCVGTSNHSLRWWLASALASIVLVLAAGATCLYVVLQHSLPQMDGSLRVPGLQARVDVIRDAHGVPTIRAGNMEDLFFAQGFVTAQDRLWEMDVTRRDAAGELAEILGGKMVEFDREQRILGVRQAARKTVELGSAEDHRYYAAYARGVNAYAESHRNHLPLEFRMLRYGFRPWTPEDSALVAVEMVRTLNHDAHQLTREKFLAALGPELTADLYVNTSWHDHPPTAQPSPPPAAKNSGDQEDEDDGEPLDLEGDHAITGLPFRSPSPELSQEPAIGSNNWVISGAHTVTGKPLLSNDMHLQYQIPNLWYEAHLECGAFNVAGVTLPGLPYVIAGHNARIAWGFTNLGPTVQDLYVEEFNAAGEYLTPRGWKNPEHRREVIHVKDAPDVIEDVVLTRHGPVVTNFMRTKRGRSHCDPPWMTAFIILSSLRTRRGTGRSSVEHSPVWMLPRKTWCTRTWTATSATRPRVRSRSGKPATAACRFGALTTRTSGAATSATTNYPALRIPLPASWRPRTGESCQTSTHTR